MELGKNEKLSNADYHGDREYLSSSALKLVRKDKIAFLKKYILGQELEGPQDAFDFGTALHTAVLEPHLFDSEIAIFPGAAKRGKSFDEFKEINNDKLVLVRPDKLKIDKILKTLEDHEAGKDIFKDGVAEETYCAVINDMKLKIRADYIKGNCLIDLKSTSAPLNLSSLQNSICSYDYDLSAALYMDVANQYRKEKIENFFFVFASKKSYDIMVVKLSDAFIANGRRKYMQAIEKYKQLEREGFFTIKDLGAMIVEIDVPAWGEV